MAGKTGRVKINDEETNAIVYEGASISQLVRLFGRDRELINQALVSGATPITTRGGLPIYRVADVAHLIVNPLKNLDDKDIERLIQKMNPIDLPKGLTKEFWSGMRQRQQYEEDAGDLWRTEKVVEHMGEVFKVVKQALLVGRDTIDEQVKLTEQQRGLVASILDSAMEACYIAVKERFGGAIDATEDSESEEL